MALNKTPAISLLFIALGAFNARADGVCDNNYALATLPAAHAQELADFVMIINSLPLSGKILANNGNAAIVKVIIPLEFARTHGLDSFDVAKKVKGIAEAKPEWKVRRIQVQVCASEAAASPSNVGTIGH